ncbi:MAG: hypothetical protein ACKOU7_11780 [Ferruginibacter sp.]
MLIFKKQLVAFGLLLLVALPLFFTLGIYISQQLVQYQREERFKTELLEVVTVKTNEVSWVKLGKEIQVDGRLFDVKSFKVTGSNIIFTGFFDSKEDKLANHIRKIEQQKNDSGNPLNQVAVKFLFLPNYKESAVVLTENNWQFIKKQFPVYAESTAIMPYPAVAPPPKYC